MAGNDKEQDFLVLDLDDGSKVECLIITQFEALDRDYIALLPMDENGDAADDVWIYRIEGDYRSDDINLSNIETDEEWEVVSDIFDEILDEEAFEEDFDED